MAATKYLQEDEFATTSVLQFRFSHAMKILMLWWVLLPRKYFFKNLHSPSNFEWPIRILLFESFTWPHPLSENILQVPRQMLRGATCKHHAENPRDTPYSSVVTEWKPSWALKCFKNSKSKITTKTSAIQNNLKDITFTHTPALQHCWKAKNIGVSLLSERENQDGRTLKFSS